MNPPSKRAILQTSTTPIKRGLRTQSQRSLPQNTTRKIHSGPSTFVGQPLETEVVQSRLTFSITVPNLTLTQVY